LRLEDNDGDSAAEGVKGIAFGGIGCDIGAEDDAEADVSVLLAPVVKACKGDFASAAAASC